MNEENNMIYEENTQGEVNDVQSGKGQKKGLGIASMICGIVSIVTICCSSFLPFVPAILGIVAIVLGIIQIVKNESKGMAIAGIICGAVGLLIYVVLFAVGLAVLSSMDTTDINQVLEQIQQMQ